MARSSEHELVKSLIWSKTEYSLAEFIKVYSLPQVVCVTKGYYSGYEETSFGSQQVLALHETLSTQKVIGADSLGKSVAIPLDCSAKVVVLPFKCKNTTCEMKDLKSINPKVKYVKVKSLGDEMEKTATESESTCHGDILEITKVDKNEKLVRCRKVETKEDISLGYTSPVTFTPLQDYRRYTLTEVKAAYGFPARVQFVSDTVNIRNRGRSTSGRSSSTRLLMVGDIILQKEANETTVVCTIVGGEQQDKRCIAIPKDLPVNFAVAEGIVKGGGNYEEVVTKLHADFKMTRFADFDQVDIYQHLNAVKRYKCRIAESPEAVLRPVPKSHHTPTPLKRSIETISLPRIPATDCCFKHGKLNSPPKVFPKPSKNNTKLSVQENLGILRKSTSTLDVFAQQLENEDRHLRTKNVCGTRTFNDREPLEDKCTSVVMERLVKTRIYDNDKKRETQCAAYHQTGSSCKKSHGQSEYENLSTEIFRIDDCTEERPMLKTLRRTSEILTETPKELTPISSSTTSLSELKGLSSNDLEEFSRRVALIPHDLSSLTVNEVSDVLRSLNMECYVKDFEAEMIDGELLKDLDLKSMESLNMTLFHRTKMNKFINGWRPRTRHQKQNCSIVRD